MNPIYTHAGAFIIGAVVMYFIRYKVVREAKRVQKQIEDATDAIKGD